MVITYRAFRMVSLLRAEEARAAYYNLRGNVIQDLGGRFAKSEHFESIVKGELNHVVIRNREYWVRDKYLLNNYTRKYFGHLWSHEEGVIGYKDFNSEELGITLINTILLLNYCIKRGFIESNIEDPELIRLSDKGRNFADHLRIGLLNEYIKVIGKSWALIVWILTFMVGRNWEFVLNLVKKFFIWLF